MNLPNKLSITRICLVPVFMLFIMPFPNWEFMRGFNEFVNSAGIYVAGVIFILASMTDFIDGHIARKRNLVTDFGKFLDPIADKMLVASAVIALTERGCLSGWFAFIILGRELLITGFRLVVAGKGVVIAANMLGKIKTVFQTVAISVLIFEIKFKELFSWYPARFTPGDFIMLIAVILTIASGYVYLKKNFKLLGDDM